MFDLLQRRVFSVYRSATGKPLSNKVIKIELLRDLFASGKTIPQQAENLVTSNEVGHEGEYEALLYCIEGFPLPYRITLSTRQTYKFWLEPGEDIAFEAVINLEEAPEQPPISLELSAVIQAVATATVAAHEAAADPHLQYFNEARADARYLLPPKRAVEFFRKNGDGFPIELIIKNQYLPAFKKSGRLFPVGLTNNSSTIPARRASGAEFNINLTGE